MKTTAVIVYDSTGRIWTVSYGEAVIPKDLKAIVANVPENVLSIERVENDKPVFNYIPAESTDSYDQKIVELTAKLTDAERSFKKAAQVLSESATDAQAILIPEIYDEWAPNMPYRKGQRVRYKGDLYNILSDHVSQENWMPTYAPSLFAKIINETTNGEVPTWQQPDSTNPYNKNDEVVHNGKHYISMVDGNVWEPGVAGTESLWQEVE